MSKSKQIYKSANGLRMQNMGASMVARLIKKPSERIEASKQVEHLEKKDSSENKLSLGVIC